MLSVSKKEMEIFFQTFQISPESIRYLGSATPYERMPVCTSTSKKDF
jgi:hypothetical protein